MTLPGLNAGRLERLPHRHLPLLYFGLAHGCLLLAFGVVALRPESVAGFFYHPRMLAVVHLVTLGWITSSILGALYMIAPMALRTPMPASRLDLWAFAGFAVGATGMAAHLWIGKLSGMVWAAGLVLLALAPVIWRAGTAIHRAPLKLENKLHFYLAFFNLLLAAGLGLLIGLDKMHHLLPGNLLSRVYAHAHLAALGWATMMVMAAGYRLLPMLLPSAMPTGPGVWASAVLTELGVLGLATSLILQSRWAGVFGALCIMGIVAFLTRLRWMLRHPRPAPRALARPDFGVLHVYTALVCLALAVGLGGLLLVSPPSALKLQAAMAYGALGLIGFLTQMVVGVASRLVPLYAWLRAFGASSFQVQPPSPHSLSVRWLQAVVFGLWCLGAPLLAVALTLDRHLMLRLGAILLFAAVLLHLLHQARVVRTAVTHRSRPVRHRRREET